MAENKKKVIVYTDWINMFIKLTDEEAGKLIKHFFMYVNDLNPETSDRLTDLLFEPIKQQLKRDLKKYEAVCERNKVNGLNGGRPKIETQINPNKPTGLILNPNKPSCKKNNPNKPDTDTDNDIIDNDNINTTINTFPEKPEKVDFIELIILSFSEKFEKYRGFPYHIANQKVERSMAGKLLKAYKLNVKNKGKTSEETQKDLSEFFEKCMLITEPWLNQNMSLSIVINKFNQIINILRNGNQQRKNEPATSNEQLADVFAKHFATDYPGK